MIDIVGVERVACTRTQSDTWLALISWCRYLFGARLQQPGGGPKNRWPVRWVDGGFLFIER